ncbi:MAG: penicillin-binding transpeptidase domain-containing protein, partial [Thiotrichaceae bacterium]
WAESATLAVLPNSPALIHPGRHRKALKNKRNTLLLKLKQLKLIDKLSYDLAIIEPLPTSPSPLPRLASHLLDTLTTKSNSDPNTNNKRFISTLDRTMQTFVNQIITAHTNKLKLQGIHNIAALVIDNESFEVKAYIGNSSTKQTGSQGHAIDLVRRPRSSGSTLKPFLFANMIQAGEILPETLIPDVPIRYAGFRPQNYDRSYRGAVRAKEALARSLNIPAANMLSQYGVGRFQSNLKKMGMTTLHRNAQNYGLTLILGGAEGTLWEITSLYANLAKLANQSNTDSMTYWLKPSVTDTAPAQQVSRVNLTTASAWMTLQALLEVTRPGTDGYWRKFSSSKKIAWKTGTSVGHRDAWALGVTPKYTVGVWVGNANGTGITGLTGVKAAAPVLFDIFNQVLPSPVNQQKQWFKKPHWQMKTVTICQDDGYLAINGCSSQPYDIPENSFFDKISPYHEKIHLDPSEQWQVHNACESVSNMRHISWFILPPDQAHYYQQHNANYAKTPTFRSDCLTKSNVFDSSSVNNPISLIYPKTRTQIYIPTKLDGKPSKAVFRAIHRNPESRLFWHIDNQYLGSTQTFHQQAVWIKAGKHVLTIIDEVGNRKEQTFVVLDTAE